MRLVSADVKGVFSSLYLKASKSADWKLSSLKNKVGAVLPWVGSAVLSGVAAGLGAHEFALAVDGSPEKIFLNSFQQLYGKAKTLQNQYESNVTKLMVGECI
ncbi:MAG: hypothetical protein KA436_11955 [Oligoflexales bacterium]|nr:hypothetical protein [Oligoflexales bacterium]